MKTQPNAQPNQSLIDGITTLQALATAQEPVGCRQLARQLGFDPTKVNRLLKTLAYLGIARQLANRKYTSGPGMHVLAAQSLFASGLIRRATPALESLRRFGHTVALGVLWNDSVSYLFHAPPGVDTARAVGRIGLLPATTSGIGMALLTELDGADLESLYSGREIANYAHGLPSLLDDVARFREQGYARVHVSDDRDHHTVAIVLGDPVHAGLGVSGWIPEEATAAIVEALQHAARQICDDAVVA